MVTDGTRTSFVQFTLKHIQCIVIGLLQHPFPNFEASPLARKYYIAYDLDDSDLLHGGCKCRFYIVFI